MSQPEQQLDRFEPIPVLDRGFVHLVDFLGGDLAVVQAARVSFGQETKGDERDRKLINYLMRHEHGTPFEMSVFKFHIKAPIFVARQWMRHRVGCLSGETLLHFDLPSGKQRGESELRKISLRKLYGLWRDGDTCAARGQSRQMNLRMCNEETGIIEHTRIADIWQSGVKPVYRVTLENDYQIKMTGDHRCLTESGWLTLKQATNLRRTMSGAVVWSDNAPAFAVNGELQRVAISSVAPFHPSPDESVAPLRRISTARLMRIFSPVARIEYAGEEMTYDVEVTGPFHNFVANGFVVHNSYNEISYRYVEVEDEFYVPGELRAQDTKNKQASFGGSFTEEGNAEGRAMIEEAYAAAYEKYKQLLRMGVAREMARIVLPVGMYTQFYVAYNARSLMNFVRLRMGEGAQAEIRLYAEAMNRIFKERMPWTHAAFEQFALGRGEEKG